MSVELFASVKAMQVARVFCKIPFCVDGMLIIIVVSWMSILHWRL